MACYVSIMTNQWHTVLYTGMTSRIEQRIQQHRGHAVPSFTSRYNVNKVVYAKVFPTRSEAAIAERKIKGWTRKKKIALIESINPEWHDLLTGDAARSSP
ncbi:MAG: GIY-YIG nuclease family protein [bacterium]